MRIHITYTGGTIGMVESEHGLVPGADMAGWLRQLLSGSDELTPDQVSLTQLDPLIDSSNATPENWQTMIDDLRTHRDDADAFVVLHGTDTMSYSSAALSYALTDFGKPVIFTGSQHPLGRIESDAAANMTGALNAALSGRVGKNRRAVLDSATNANKANARDSMRRPPARLPAPARHGNGSRSTIHAKAGATRRLTRAMTSR